jgi:hypothetical protein
MKASALTIDEILSVMLKPESQVRRIGSPETPEEHAVEVERRITMVREGKVRTVCVGCGQDVSIGDTAPCECGGFVCKACERLEEDGVCAHETFVLPDDDDE